jgi:hypothetical protein
MPILEGNLSMEKCPVHEKQHRASAGKMMQKKRKNG